MVFSENFSKRNCSSLYKIMMQTKWFL